MEMQLNLVKKWKPDEQRTLDLDTSLSRYHTGQFDKVFHSRRLNPASEPSILLVCSRQSDFFFRKQDGSLSALMVEINGKNSHESSLTRRFF
jgi:hypothetical protein